MAALAGSFYAVWPRRPVPGKAPGATALALAATGLAADGVRPAGRRVREVVLQSDEPPGVADVPAVAASDLDPPWTEAPLDPFEIPTLRPVRIPTVSGPARWATPRAATGGAASGSASRRASDAEPPPG